MPVRQWVRPDGSVVRVFATNEPHKFRVEVDEVPWDPEVMVAKATK